MAPCIQGLLDRVRRRFTPRGRREWSGAVPSAPQARSAPTAPAWTVRGWYEPLDGDATALVRPYLRAYEREEAERARQWWRGGLLWGTYDVGPGTSDAQRAGAAA